MDILVDKKSLLQTVKSNNLMDILPAIMSSKIAAEGKITPSQFIKEMSYTTEERYKLLLRRSPQTQDSVSHYSDISVSPCVLVFQSYEIHKSYSIVMQVRNCRKTLLPIKMECPKSTYFGAKIIGSPVNKLAPGLSADYEVTFTPTEDRDYEHELIFKTEGDTFSIPIIAIGPRILIDFPDEITLPPAPVKIAISKVLIAKNIGSAGGCYTFTKRGCFKVEPAKGYVNPFEILNFSIIFESAVVGNFSEVLHLNLDTGESLAVSVHGSAENINVRLDKNFIYHDDTFFGLERSKIFHIQNNSPNLLKFSWKRNKSVKEDLSIIERMKKKYKEINDLEIRRDTKQEYLKLCSHKVHELACERILEDELRLLETEEFRFHHPAFLIEPESGEIFPKCQVELFAVFRPTTCGPVHAEAYMEVSGRDERLTLRMKGNGLGPNIALSIEVLDIDFIFLCSVHTYEIVAHNKGDIPGTISFRPEPLVFGGKVEVTPCTKYLNPSEHAALLVSFTSNKHGDFTEKLNFEILESGEVVSFILKGKIVSPTLHFDKTQIDFGTVSVGFPVSKEVTLSNLSMVPVTFSLRVLSDGNQQSISHEKFAKMPVKPRLPKSPKEFQIEPMEGVVEPYSRRSVVLTLTANIARKWSTNLMVDMWDSETESVSCPIRFTAQTPNISIEPSIISIPFCFVDFPYTRVLTLENTSRISSFYYIVPQDLSEPSSITYSANITQGIIEQKGSAKISLTIRTSALGRQTLPLYVLILGNDSPIDVCQICCVGQGPVVTLKPNSLVWGEVSLLKENTKELTISNESPISASFVASMGKPDSPWIINPSHSILTPGEKIVLNVSLLLRDRGKYQDVIKIQIFNGKTLSCSTSAIGIGNSLFMEPNISDKFILGTLFSHKKYSFPIYIKNEGTKTIGIVWCPIEDYKAFVANKFVNPPDLIFTMEPRKIDLQGGASRVLNLEVYSSQTGFFTQHFYCHANVDMPSKELYMISEISAEFVEPLIEFDKEEVPFFYNISSKGINEQLTNSINIINKSVLPIDVSLTANHPFSIISNSESVHKMDLELCGNEKKKLEVRFTAVENPYRQCLLYTDKLTVTFKEHSKKVSSILHGEVNYPNVLILPRNIDFGCIPVGSSAYREFIIVNISPVEVNFRITWEEKSSSVTFLTRIDFPNKSSLFDAFDEYEESVDDYIDDKVDNDVLSCDDKSNERGLEISKAADQEILRTSDGMIRPEEQLLSLPKKPILKIPEVVIKEEDLKNMVFPLVRRYYFRDEVLINAYKGARSARVNNGHENPPFTEFFDITPFYGRLDKYESQIMSVCFQPSRAMRANAVARLDIETGPTESVTINGTASDLSYALDKLHIHFGRQLYCETANEYLKITNTSLVEFDFETSTVDPISVDLNGDFPIEAGVLIVTPRIGHVPGMTEKVLRVRYHPGLPGKFEERFQLRIGYLEPITIHVSGFAVFPQVHLSLRRIEMSNLPVEVGYAAVASITPDWLLTRISCQRIATPLSDDMGNPQKFRSKNHPSTETSVVELEDDWVIIYDLECVPSEIDIDLATERILAFRLLTSSNHVQTKLYAFSRAIPNFFVPAYEIDFGVVIAGRSVEETITVMNYGPLPAVLYFPLEKEYKNRVMRIRMKTRHDIRVGGSAMITISFDPVRARFMEQYEKVEYMFYFEVNHGARIPVKATAVVTYPSVVPSTKYLNFNEVKCGNCKLMSMKLKNLGCVPAAWNLSFRLTSREIGLMHQSGILDGRSMFQIMVSKDILYPNESCLLQISFKPEFGGKFSATLIIKVDEGLEEHRVTLTGEAVESRLKISETIINFGATLPYPRKLCKCFKVQNPCTFPVEFYFPDFDRQIIEENSILRALVLYHQTNELLLPVRNPGDGLPQEVTDFYHNLLENLNAKYVEKLKEKPMKSYENFSVTAMLSNSLRESDIFDKRRLKIKRISSTARLRSRIFGNSTGSVAHGAQEGLPILRDKTPEEIEDMLYDYIKYIAPSDVRLNTLSQALGISTMTQQPEELEVIRGLVIILHAAPHSSTSKLAQMFMKLVTRPCLTIDRIVVEEMALARCDIAIILRNMVEKSYEEHILKNDNAWKDSEDTLNKWKQIPFEEAIKDLGKKLNELFTLREFSGPASGLTVEEKASSLSSSRKEKSSIPNIKLIQAFEGTEEWVLEILKFRLQIEAINGVLIEHLNSSWITNHSAALKTVIKASGNITDILVICIRMSFEKYKELVTLEKAEEEMREFEMRENALKVLEEESNEAFEAIDLPEETKKEIMSRYLISRHEQYNAYVKTMEERARLRKSKTANIRIAYSPGSSLKGQRADSSKEREITSNSARNKDKTAGKDKAPRSKATSEIEQGSDLIKKQMDNEKEAMFRTFDEQLTDMIFFLQYWDRKLGISTVPAIANKGKKSATPRKSTGDFGQSDIGVPLWIINESNKKSLLGESVYMYLQQALMSRKKSYESENWGQDVPESVTYTVVTSPPHRHPTVMVPAFTLASLDRSASVVSIEEEKSSEEISDSQLSMRSKKKYSENGKPRMESRASVGSKHLKTKKSLPSGLLTDQNLKTRCLLQEGESAIWCVQFYPTKVGRYEQYYPISTVSSLPNNNYVIKCTGICDTPRLDMNPENIFTRVAWKKPVDLIYLPTFFYSKYYFDFGSVIPNQLKDEGHDRELHAIFSLTNISSLPVELTVMFAEDALRENPIGSKNFDLEPTEAHLEPDQTFLLNVYANPSKYGPVEELLLLFIKGNPKIESIMVKCYGVKVSVNVEPKAIDFDRMLLYRKDRRRITFTNSNLIPLLMVLSGYNKLPPQFSFSAVKSWVQPLMSFSIEIEYEANEVRVLNNEVIYVLIYDRSEAVDPVHSLSFTVSAEAYDASVDIYIDSKEENHMDFEDLRIQNEYKKSVTLKNTGKYDLGFKIVINYELLEEYGNEEFFVFPGEGNLAVGKIFQLAVNFLARTEVHWKRLPLFRINLIEPYKNNELVASIPINVSARSFFSRYIIQPLSEVSIGPVEVGLQKSAKVSIENRGHFSFAYSIESPFEESIEPDVNKKSSKKASEASSRQKKIPVESLTTGCFEISPSSGIVNVKETAFIHVNFMPSEVRRYEEIVVLKISESPPHLKDGNELKIAAEGCIPELNFDDWGSIFREHHIRNSEKDIPQPSEFGYQTVFTIDKQQLCFRNVCLGKTVEGRIHLENKGQINCHVTLSISKGEFNKSRTSQEVESEFWVKPSSMIIPPYEYGTFVIFFRPEMILDFRSQLTLTLIMPERYNHITKIIDLYGLVCVPRIEIIEPILRSNEGSGEVIFRPTTPGRTTSSVISFKNAGSIDSKVILEIQHGEEGIFSLMPTSETECMLQAWESSKPITHTTLVTVSPGKIAEFQVFFKPSEIKKYSGEIRLFVVDNGFENVRFSLSGESFLEEVVLERIQTVMPFAENTEESSSCSQTVPGHYFLNLGHCFIKKKRKVLARLANKTERDFFKFEWEENSIFVSVQPSLGHLYPGTYKEILFVFLPQDTFQLEEAPLTCKLTKIHFTENPCIPPWDRRQSHHPTALMNEIELLPSKSHSKSSSNTDQAMTNILVGCEEPDHEVIPDSNSELILYLSAVADYSRPYCEVTNVNFSDTFMFQNRSFSLPLENVGNVAFDYTLCLKSVTYEPVKVHEALQVHPASIFGSRSQLRPSSSQTKHKKSARKKICYSNRPKALGNELLLDLSLEEDPKPKWPSMDIKAESYNPIHLENATGSLLPKEKVFCQIIFSPLDVNEYKGIIKIKVDNTHPDQPVPEILVTARSIMPYCHFDIPESDYIQSGRRDFSRPGPVGVGPGMPLDPEIKTIEIKVLGIRVTKSIHFYAINPTDCDYSFSWLNVTQIQPDIVQSLHCTVTDGTIQAGRQKLMEFVFVSQRPGTFEYFWKFCIPQHEIEMVFLFVVVAQEPVMYFLSNNLILPPTSVGATVTGSVTLVNEDDISSDFFFQSESLYSEGRLNSLKVQPMSGKIGPKTEMSFKISFTGKTGGKILFQLKCKLKKLQNPIIISVQTMTYTVEPLITFVDLAGVKHVAKPSVSNIVDFGTELQIEKPETIHFFLTSTSKLSFYYEWVYDRKELAKEQCSLSFSLMEGHVTAFARDECCLTIAFSRKSHLKNFPVRLKVKRGPVYHFLLNARASPINYEFSFINYDFGYCYVQNTNLSFNRTILTFKNKDKMNILLETISDNLQNFTFNSCECLVEPGKEVSIPIEFHPKECQKYEEEICFRIGGIIEKVITLSGQGTEFKVVLANVSDTNIYFGAVKIGRKQTKEFTLVNKGPTAATVVIGFFDQLPIDPIQFMNTCEVSEELVSEYRLSNVLSLTPSRPFTLRSKESYTIRVDYTPKSRTPSFSETVYIQFQERVDPLCVISGSSVGPEFSLDKNYLTFGAVVANYSSTLKLKIINSGDIGAKFKWDTNSLDNEYFISPEAGYLSAGSDVIISVTFTPKMIRPCIKQSVECKLYLSETETYPPLILKLLGDCVDLPLPTLSVTFSCAVRHSDMKKINIVNKTGTDWQLIPIFGGEYFTGLDTIPVQSMSTAHYEITYSPMTMTQPNAFHKGSMFLCMPDGSGQLYELIGTSLPPDANEIIEREVPCKTKYVELLNVKNWLRSHQKFNVTRVCTVDENGEDLVYTCSGSDVFELPPGVEKQYKLTFTAYKVGKLRFSVIFTNADTNEYIWFDIIFTVVMCGPLEVISLSSRVRQSSTYTIKIDNPLSIPIQYKVECSNTEVLIPNIAVLPPQSSGEVEIAFRPLHPGIKKEVLKVSCPELGIFPMQLHLTGLDAVSQETIHFETDLGSTDTHSIKVPNFSNIHAIFHCRTNSDEFKVDERFTAQAQGFALIDITYEPSSLGQSSGSLFIESEQAGHFIYPLIGNALKPPTKGPFTVRLGCPLTITFKNVLKTTKKFKIFVDNPAFVLKSTTVEIPSGNEYKISISLQKMKTLEKLISTNYTLINTKYPVMGQLVVECFQPDIKWQYYLKGFIDKTTNCNT